MVKQKKLSVRQRLAVQGKLKGKSDAKALRDAGYSESVAAGGMPLKTPAVVVALTELLERAGITDEKLAQRINEGLDALETKFFQKDGKVVSTRDVVNHGERRAHAELALRLKGHMKESGNGLGQQIAAILAASYENLA